MERKLYAVSTSVTWSHRRCKHYAGSNFNVRVTQGVLALLWVYCSVRSHRDVGLSITLG